MDDIDQTYFAPDGLIYMIAESRSKAESPFMPNIQTLFRKSTILSEKLKELLEHRVIKLITSFFLNFDADTYY